MTTSKPILNLTVVTSFVWCRLFAELRSYVDPPEAVLHVIKALLFIIYPREEFGTWADCKQVCHTLFSLL